MNVRQSLLSLLMAFIATSGTAQVATFDGVKATATDGVKATATAGVKAAATATAGVKATATATATAGAKATATAGVKATASASQTADKEAFQAEALYRQGRYAEAAEAYEALWSGGEHTAALMFDIALSRFRAGEEGHAVAAALRAYRLSPRDPELAKLQAALQLDVGKFIATTHPAWYAWTLSLFGVLAIKEIFWLGFALLALGLGLLTAAFWLPGEKKRHCLVPGLVLTLVTGIILPFYLGLDQSLSDWGAITQDNSPVYSEPEKKDPLVLFTVPVKTPVKEVFENAGWVRVRFADGRQGWIPKDALARY